MWGNFVQQPAVEGADLPAMFPLVLPVVPSFLVQEAVQDLLIPLAAGGPKKAAAEKMLEDLVLTLLSVTTNMADLEYRDLKEHPPPEWSWESATPFSPPPTSVLAIWCTPNPYAVLGSEFTDDDVMDDTAVADGSPLGGGGLRISTHRRTTRKRLKRRSLRPQPCSIAISLSRASVEMGLVLDATDLGTPKPDHLRHPVYLLPARRAGVKRVKGIHKTIKSAQRARWLMVAHMVFAYALSLPEADDDELATAVDLDMAEEEHDMVDMAAVHAWQTLHAPLEFLLLWDVKWQHDRSNNLLG
jgi:hypothetical protein